MAEIRRGFELHGSGVRAARARSALVDNVLQRVWDLELRANPALSEGVALVAVGGYGRQMLFPHSDVDLLFCVEKKQTAAAQAAVRRASQSLWDCGLEVALSTRAPGQCDRFEVTNPEFGLALLDARPVGGDAQLGARLRERHIQKLMQRDARALKAELARLTLERHARYGNTLFHLEPNIKDAPGGLRDANVAQWLGLISGHTAEMPEDWQEAVAFLAAVRCFLHYRHQRNDNTLDWQAQDAAASRRIGLGSGGGEPVPAAYWMRAYFRNARIVERRLQGEADSAGVAISAAPAPRRLKIAAGAGFQLAGGRLELDAPHGVDPAHEPEVVLAAFAAMAATGAVLARASEERIAAAIPVLSANLEEGPALWRQLQAILTGRRAAAALRAMHALGVLDLLLPEFHGIDALVIRDAYHRYTVDEHTFVLIETLHGLADDPGPGAPEWRSRFRTMITELQNPGLLYLVALLHDTGKSRATGSHAAESARLAGGVLQRLEMDAYDSALGLRLIENHLEMSAALRRDIFDVETVRGFAAKVQTHEALRMLTLFTYADIAAVHPDALTPWKAENLWRLSMAASNQLDRHVDDERVHRKGSLEGSPATRLREEKIARMLSLAPAQRAEVEQFLEGFPERYVTTRPAEVMLRHLAMTRNFDHEEFQVEVKFADLVPTASAAGSGAGEGVHEITLVTRDRPRLFAGMAEALAAWGMNVVTADAFANASGVVVDTFRFTDTFRTLELNESERERFVTSVREMVAGRAPAEKLLNARRRVRRRAPRVAVETRIDFDPTAAAHSTVLQVVAQDVHGLLRAISLTLSQLGYNVEVALVDTEGETAIDVFYLTRAGGRLSQLQENELRQQLLQAIAENSA